MGEAVGDVDDQGIVLVSSKEDPMVNVELGGD